MSVSSKKPLLVALGLSLLAVLGAAWLPSFAQPSASLMQGADGPRAAKKPKPIRRGSAAAGREVFRFETFGDEGFWTDAARLPQGMKAAGITVMDALDSGVQIDADRLTPALRRTLTDEFKTDRSESSAPALHDPKTLETLVNTNAVIGLVARNGKVGVSCALCHTITDGSVYAVAGKGSIGKRIDGPTIHGLNVGKLLALAANSRAFFPTLQHDMGEGKTIGRAPRGLTPESTEAEVDAYLSNPAYYPIGTFDDTPDGLGNSVHITPLFRQDLAAPFGSSGQNDKLDDFNNTVYTVLFDPTTLTTPGGRAFLKALAGDAGVKLADGYEQVLKDTGVTGYPYIQARKMGKPGAPPTPVGLRVDEKKLLDLNAYLASLPAPRAPRSDAGAVRRGLALFRAQCTACHSANQGKPVDAALVPMPRIEPGYSPMIILRRMPPLTPVQNSPGTFDDKMVVVDASPGGGNRGNALPLLLDLARKPVFLHDDSVPSLDSLLDPSRGPAAPHPFYISSTTERRDMIAFLNSLETR